jgi:LAO/AO transport system kinase
MPADLVPQVLAGSRRALARLLSHVERGEASAELQALYPHTGRAWVIGITGSPGSGKSSLVNALTQYYRAQGETVAILAVDPSSPFSGGAILGDRIRMRDLSGDSGVFIRSMATRGSLGGLARATRDMVRAIDAAGFDRILLETVGAGQSEIEVARVAYTTIVVEAPGMGDDIQAIKAGILEIADVLVVNKADRVGASQTARALKTMLELGHPPARVMHHGQSMAVAAVSAPPTAEWIPEVVMTVATERKGIVELAAAIEAHRQHRQRQHNGALDPAAVRAELLERAREALFQQWLQALPPDTIEALVAQIQQRTIDPQTAVQQLLALPPAQEHRDARS